MAISHVKNMEEVEYITTPLSFDARGSQAQLIGWKAPNFDFIKINVDGSLMEQNGCIGCGGVLRNHNGQWLGGFAKNLGKGNITVAELWGIRLGIQMAWDMQFKKVILETDSMQALSLVDKVCSEFHPLSHLVTVIRKLLNRDWTVHLAHTYREGNRLADVMAKFAHSLPVGVFCFDVPPDCCREVYRNDLYGLCLPRGFRS